jgi:hypothetical protein
LIILAGAVLALTVAGSAQAAVMGWEGTLRVDFGPFGSTVFTHDSGTFGGGGLTLNGSSGLGHLNTMGIPAQDVHGLGGLAVIPITDPGLNPALSLRASPTGIFFGGGTFGPISGGAASTKVLTQNVAGVRGLAKLFILNSSFYIPLLLTTNQTRGMGLGGLVTLGGFAPAGIAMSIQGNPWTVKTAVITGVPTTNGGSTTRTEQGFAHGPASATSSAVNIGGVVQLVTPMVVETTIGDPLFALIPLFGTLRIQITPEPGTALLFGSGMAALALANRRRPSRQAFSPKAFERSPRHTS